MALSVDHLGTQLSQDVQSFLDDAEELIMFLPHWINFRSSTLDNLTGTEGPSSVASAFSVIGNIGSAIRDKLCGLDTKLAAVSATVGNALTFGISSGVKHGVAEVNNRKLNMVVSRLREDELNTKDLEEIIGRVMQRLSALTEDLKACSALPSDNPVLGQIASVLKNPLEGKSPEFQAFIGWSHQIYLLLQKFLTILLHSKKPNVQIASLLSRNPKPPVIMGRDELNQWVRTLNEGVHAIQRARNDASQHAVNANNMLSRMLTGGVTRNDTIQIAADSTTPQQTVRTASNDNNSNTTADGIRNILTARAPNSAVQTTYDRNDNARGSSNSGAYDADRIGDSCSEIDSWFREIRQLYVESIKIAKDVERLFSEGNIPLKGSDRN